MKGLRVRFTLAAAILFVSPLLAAKEELPWAFKGTPAAGYSIDLVSVEPAPGTPLIAGSTVEFKITLSYSMSIAKTGMIILVFQDDTDRSAKAEGKQVVAQVTDPMGTVTLTDTVTIPKRVNELRLFAPLVPEGLSNTSGEVIIRYPVKKK